MRSYRLIGGIGFALFALTLATYGDLLWGERYEFVSFDDYDYVRENANVRAGLSAKGVRWAMTSFAAYNWHPLTWFSLQLDAELYGVDPRGFHITNLLLHAANAVLLFLVLVRGTGAIWPSAAVAAFFAVHPLHVESVAWISERKDVLSTFFGLLAMLAYVRYARCPSVGRYMVVFLCLALGLMSKPMVVTLPCVLLLFDYWPLRRWPSTANASDFASASVWKLVKEKIPLFLLSAGCSVLTMRAQGGLLDHAKQFVPFEARLYNALLSYVAYLRDMCWPNDLAVLYLHPRESIPTNQWLPAALVLTVVTLLAASFHRRRPYLLVGWLWYLGTLVPAIGLLQVGQQARADRYTYVPLIGIFIALSWLAADLLERWRTGRIALAATTIALVAACALITRPQLQHWRNNTTLWDRAIAVSGNHRHMHALVTGTCLDFGELDAALMRAEEFRRLHPDDWRSHQLLGIALESKGRPEEAVASLEQALALQPESAETHNHIAGILWWQGKIPEALTHLAAIARLQPDSVDGLFYRGIVLHEEGKYTEAVRCFSEAARRDPNGVLRHVNLALALEDRGDVFAAANEYRRAQEINATWPEYCDQLAWTLATDPDDARRHGKEAIRMARAACSVTNNQYAPFLETLAAGYAEAGDFKPAIETASRARSLASEGGDKKRMERLDAALQLYTKGTPFRSREPR